MRRREFVRAAAFAGAGLLLHQREVWARHQRAPLILRGATTYDGTGGRPIVGDVAIDGDRISGIGRRLNNPAAEVIDLRGLALAPGFVDIHSHTDRVLLTNPRAEAKVRQGVTTEIAGQDGSSIADLPEFMAQLEKTPGSVNWASMVGAGTIRQRIVGTDDRPATSAELQRKMDEVRSALRAGAVGLSSGLEYAPGGFATIDEL